MELRATADAVMAGARTVDANKVTLGPGSSKYRRQRIRRHLAEYNLRVIVSRSGSISPGAAVFKHRFSPIIILTSGKADRKRIRELSLLATEVKPFGNEQINFHAALRWLRSKWGVRRVVCEGGGELNDALFRADLVDELHLTVCPLVFGGRNAPTIADGIGASSLAKARNLECHSARRAGNEMYFIFRKG